MSLPRPPRRPQYDTFYVSYAPELLKELIGADVPTVAGCIALEVRGEVDVYYVGVRDGLVVASTDPIGDVVAHISMSHDAWQTAATDMLRMVLDVIEPHHGEFKRRLHRWFERAAQEELPDQIHALVGQVGFAYEDDAGDTWLYDIKVGQGEGPVSRIAINDHELRKLLADRPTPMQMVRARLTIEGDVDYLLALAKLLEQ